MTAGRRGDTAWRDIYFQGTSSWKLWDGADGKIETSGANSRSKWNRYYFERARRRRARNSIDYTYSTGPSDPNVYNGNLLLPAAFDSGLYPILDWDSNSQIALLDKLSRKIKQHDFNLAVSLGELNRTTSMVTGTLGKLGRSMLALKRGDFANAARQLGSRPRGTRLKASDISGRWLELQYGWRPLVSDCYSAAEAYHALTKGPRKIRQHASGHFTKDYEGAVFPSLSGSQPFQASIDRQITAELSEPLSTARSLGLLNPVSVAWELLPYSFVVDWFIPIGSYIDVLFTIPLLNGRFLVTDTKRIKYHGRSPGLSQYIGKYWLGTGQWILSADTPSDDLSEVIYSDRKVETSLSVPLPRFDLSGLAKGKRVWNAIALAHQRFAS